MLKPFTSGIVTGILIGAACVAVWVAGNRDENPLRLDGLNPDADLEDLMFADAKLEDIFRLPWIHGVLKSPESITVHLRSKDGPIQFGDFRFATENRPLNVEDTQALSHTLRAMSAYQVGLGLACLYNPGALVRIEAGSHRVDFLVCFQCRVADWYADGKHVNDSIAPRVGFSDLGFRILWRIVAGVYPDKLHLSEAIIPITPALG